MRNLVLASAITIVCGSGCTKYQDGPLVALQSLTSRAANNWIVDMAFKNTADTITNLHFELDLNKNGTAIFSDTTVVDSVPQIQVVTEHGSWAFTNDNADIVMILNHNQDQKIWQILRLTDSQFWVLEQQGKDYYQYNLKIKK